MGKFLSNAVAEALPKPKKTPRRGKAPKYNVVRERDTEIKGFTIVSTTGAKSWYFVYRNKFTKAQRSYLIGQYPQLQAPKARAIAKELYAQVIQGHDPQTEKNSKVREGSLEEYSALYLKSLLDSKSSQYESDRHIKQIRPHLGKLRLYELKKSHIEQMMKDMKKTPTQANRTFAYLHKFFEWCVDNKHMATNPAKKIAKYKEKERYAYLQTDELAKVAKFLTKWKQEQPTNCIFIALLFATGRRPAEIYKRPWKEVNLETGHLVNIDTKTGKQFIPLSPNAISLFKQLKELTGPSGKLMQSRWCFPSPVKKDAHIYEPPKNLWDRMREETGLDYQMRDMRHHFATQTASDSQSLGTVKELLSHADISTTMRYAHILDADKQKALKKSSKALKLL